MTGIQVATALTNVTTKSDDLNWHKDTQSWPRVAPHAVTPDSYGSGLSPSVLSPGFVQLSAPASCIVLVPPLLAVPPNLYGFCLCASVLSWAASLVAHPDSMVCDSILLVGNANGSAR